MLVLGKLCVRTQSGGETSAQFSDFHLWNVYDMVVVFFCFASVRPVGAGKQSPQLFYTPP